MADKPKNHVIHNPHDRAFLAAMRQKAVAIDAIRAYLPEAVFEQIDLDKIQRYPTKFVTPDLQEFRADLLYQLPLKSGQTEFALLHCEHQSTVDSLMPLRMWHYLILLMRDYLENRSKAEQQFPVVHSLIFYTGEQRYNASTDFWDLFAEGSEAAKARYLKPFELIDVCRLSDKAIAEHGLIGLSELLFKHKQDKDIEAIIEKLSQGLQQLACKLPVDHAKMLLTYLARTFRYSNAETLEKVAKKHAHDPIGEELMTAAQEWQQRGMQQGVQATNHKVIMNLSRLDMPIETIAKATGYTVEQVKKELN